VSYTLFINSLKNKPFVCILFTKTLRGRGVIVSLSRKLRDSQVSRVHFVSALVSGHLSLIAENLSYRPVKCATARQMTTTIKNTSTARSSPSPASSRRSLMASFGGRGALIIRQSCRRRNRHSPVCALFTSLSQFAPLPFAPPASTGHSEMIGAGIACAILNFQLLTIDCKLS